MCATLMGISHREVLNAASREANGIKMLQRTRDSSQKQFVASHPPGCGALSWRGTTVPWQLLKRCPMLLLFPASNVLAGETELRLGGSVVDGGWRFPEFSVPRSAHSGSRDSVHGRQTHSTGHRRRNHCYGLWACASPKRRTPAE